MEGDAGASRLTPNDTDEQAPLEPDAVADDSTAEETAEDSLESDDAADQRSPSQTPKTSLRSPKARTTRAAPRVWAAAGSSVSQLRLAVLAGGTRRPVGTSSYCARIRTARPPRAGIAAAVEAAKDCVGATQAPDIGAMASSAQKIVECGAGAFRSQAILYSGLLVDAYQAANAHVQVSDLRAAVERNNPDGSVEILVPLRVKVSNSEAQNQEAGYRLRVTMVLDEGKYRISKLDQVAR